MAAKLDIIINAQDDASEAIEGVGDSLGGLEKSGANAGLSLTDLNSGLQLAKSAFSAVEGAVKSVIDPTIEYAGEVRTLSRTIGASAEEASKLIQAADDVGISAGTVQSALEAAIKKGVKPSIEGIAALADEYNAIQDPIERTKFLMDNFGRAGADLAPLMEQGADGIRAAGQAAEDAGLVMSQEGVDSARAYEVAMDDLQDSVLAVKLALAEDLIPAITASVKEMTAVKDSNQAWTDALAEGIVTQDEAAAALLRVRTGATSTAEELANLKLKVDNYHQGLTEVDPAVQNMRLAQDDLTGAAERATVAIQSQDQWLADLASVSTTTTTPATYDLLTATDLLTQGMSGLTDQLVFQQAAQGLSADAALQLAINMGLVDTRVLALNEALPALKAKYDANHDGTIDAAESAAGYAAAVERLNAALQATPPSVTSTVTTNFVTNGVPPGAYTGAPAGPPQQPTPYAAGGNYSGGGPITTGEQGPELQFPSTPGYVMNNNMSGRLVNALEAIARGGNSSTYNFYGVGADLAAGQVGANAGAF